MHPLLRSVLSPSVTPPAPPKSTPERPEDRFAVKALRAGDLIFLRVYHDLTILSAPKLPRVGPAILVCDHVSSLDPALVQAACHDRAVTWMMAKEYMDVRGMGWFFRSMGVIPVDRGGRDSGSLRAALRALKDGQVLGVFPEGRISTTDGLLPFHTGAALMAMKTGVPVYPAYQDGSHRGKEMLQACLQPARAAIAFGPPVDLSSPRGKLPLEEATARITAAVEALRPAVRQRLRTPW